MIDHADVDSTVIEIICLVNSFFKDYNKTAYWLRAKNLNFGDSSPVRLINQNRSHKVLSFVKTALDENKPIDKMEETLK